MGRKSKEDSEKVIRITFSIYPETYILFKEYKANMDIKTSDSAVISYLIQKGIKSLNQDLIK
jgi:hypothetical protein